MNTSTTSPTRSWCRKELAHIRANHAGRFPDYAADRTCRGAAEVEAESIAYIVTTHLGMNVEAYSVPYLAGWADDLDVLRHHMSTVVTVAQGLVHDVEAGPAAGPDASVGRIGALPVVAAAPAPSTTGATPCPTSGR